MKVVDPSQYDLRTATAIVKQCEVIERDRFNIEDDDPDVRSRDICIREAKGGRLKALVVVLQDLMVVGFVLLDETTAGEIYLDTIAVARDHEGNGVARVLLNQVDEYAKNKHAEMIWLKVDLGWGLPEGPKRLIGIYKKHGYQPVEDPAKFTQFHSGKTIMAKKLP